MESSGKESLSKNEGVLQIIKRKRKYISENLVKDPTVSFNSSLIPRLS